MAKTRTTSTEGPHRRNKRVRGLGAFEDVQAFVREANRMSDMTEMRSLLPQVAHGLGFEYFALVHHVALNVASPDVVRLSNYPLGWSGIMVDRGYFSEDPILAACQRSVAGFLWSDVGKIIDLSQRQMDILQAARRAGMGEGFTVPAHVPGEYNGSCSFSARFGRQVHPEALPAAQYIGCFSFEAARRISQSSAKLPAHEAAKRAQLTQRQFDCVVLAAKGKTDWEISVLLGISQETVHQHIETAKKRFGVATRMQLVVRTLFDSQLTFSDVLR